MLARVSSRELTEWAAYEQVSGPIGPERLDRLFGMLASVVANAQRSKKGRPYKPEQFIPKWDPKATTDRRPEMTGEEMLRAVRRANKAMGG